MLRTTLLAAAAVLAFGATGAYAGADGGYRHEGHNRGDHAGYEHAYVPGPQAGHYRHYRGHHGGKHGYRHGRSWFDYRRRPYCHFAPRKVPIKVWDRRGNSYHEWVWKDVRVCV